VTIRDFVSLPGSVRSELTGSTTIGPVPPGEHIEVTLVLRRRAELPADLVQGPDNISRDQLARGYGADPADTALVHEIMAAAGLEVLETDLGSRRLRVAGRAWLLANLFGTELTVVDSADPAGGTLRHRARSGELRIAEALSGIVIAVLGLDDRPQSRAHSHLLRVGRQAREAAGITPHLPRDLGGVYEFPPNTDGHGARLAIIEFGGGFHPADLQTCFSELGIPAPDVQAVGLHGATNSPTGDPTSADGEVLLDIEVAGALAPGAEQIVYFAPNTDRGFVEAISAAVHGTPTPTAISISWGAPEDQWTAQARTAIDQALADAAALGVTVCVAAGDRGSADGRPDGREHVDFPASSPHALGCGGTRLETGTGGTVVSETVWNAAGNASGGGVSEVFALPPFQATAGVPARTGGGAGRGVPDVAADADPQTGYVVFVDGEWLVSGGTSAVAPLWAALVCRLAQARNRPLGLIHTYLYAGVRRGQVQPGFRDVTLGNNGAYNAGPGWDACTGLGVPNGVALLKAWADNQP
jgi:kumamolisin